MTKPNFDFMADVCVGAAGEGQSLVAKFLSEFPDDEIPEARLGLFMSIFMSCKSDEDRRAFADSVLVMIAGFAAAKKKMETGGGAAVQ